MHIKIQDTINYVNYTKHSERHNTWQIVIYALLPYR